MVLTIAALIGTSTGCWLTASVLATCRAMTDKYQEFSCSDEGSLQSGSAMAIHAGNIVLEVIKL